MAEHEVAEAVIILNGLRAAKAKADFHEHPLHGPDHHELTMELAEPTPRVV